jgi:peptidoglycan/LPS O-acetylase OafA/YrhL
MAKKALQDVHLRICANRRTKVSLLFVAFCVMETLLVWRPLVNNETADRGTVFVLGLVVTIAVLIQMLRLFRCRRERIVLGLAIASFGASLISAIAPSFMLKFEPLVTRADLVLWIIAVVLSLSMLVSSLSRKPGI